MDANLDDIEMNDELLDKLVTAMLQDNTLNLHTNSEASNLPAQFQLSCNHVTQEPNSTNGLSDNTLQVWQKLLEGDGTMVEHSQLKSIANPLMNPRSASQTPNLLLRSFSEDIFHRSSAKIRSQLIAASTPRKAIPETHFEVSPLESSSTASSAKRKTISTTNCKNQKSFSTNSISPEPSVTRSIGPITRSRSASKASQSDSPIQLTTTPDSSTRYYLRSCSSAGSHSNAKSCSSQSKNISSTRQRTPKDSSSHQYETRSRTGSSKVEVIKRCTELAVVVRRARMSMITRLRGERSSIRLPTPKARLEARSLPTPKIRLRPRKLATSKIKLEPRSLPTSRRKLQPRRSSKIRLEPRSMPTSRRLQSRRLAISKTKLETQNLPTPRKRLQPRRLSLRKVKVSASKKNSRHVLSVRKR